MISHTCSYMAAYGFALSLTRGLRIESDLRVGTFLPMIYHVGDQLFTYSVVPLRRHARSSAAGRTRAAIAEMIAEERVTALWAAPRDGRRPWTRCSPRAPNSTRAA